MAKKDRLKNGLDMLFEDNFHDDSDSAAEDSGKGLQTVRISLIEPDKSQPRKNFDAEKLAELSDNISQHGLLQPILVRPIENGGYRIVAGERRWRAARMANLEEVPVIIRELTDIEAAQIALIENLQREDLSPIEEARAYQRLIDDFKMTQERISATVGKSRAAIANSIRLLRLQKPVQDMLENKTLSAGHAKLLCGIENPEVQVNFANRCIEDKLTVRELEKAMEDFVKIVDEPEKKSKIQTNDSGEIVFKDEFKKFAFETESAFKMLFGVDTTVKKESGGKYSVKFVCKNEEDLRDIIARFTD